MSYNTKQNIPLNLYYCEEYDCERCKGKFADGAKTGAAAVAAIITLGGALVKIVTKK